MSVLIHKVKTSFNCPYCDKLYKDEDEKYNGKVNKTKQCWITIKCCCGEKFGMTSDIRANAVGFKL